MTKKSITLTSDEQVEAWNNLKDAVESSDYDVPEWGDSPVEGEVARLAADAFTGRL